MPKVQQLNYVSSIGIVPTTFHQKLIAGNIPESSKCYVSAVGSEKDEFKGYLITAERTSSNFHMTIYECNADLRDEFTNDFQVKETTDSFSSAENYLSNAIVVDKSGTEMVYFCTKRNPATDNEILVQEYNTQTFDILPIATLVSRDSDLQGQPQLFYYNGTLGCITREQKHSSSLRTLGMYLRTYQGWQKPEIPSISIDNGTRINVITYGGYIYIFYSSSSKRKYIRTDLSLWDVGPEFSSAPYNFGGATIHNGYVRLINYGNNELFDFIFDGNQVIKRASRSLNYPISIDSVQDLTCMTLGNRLVVPMFLKVNQ